MTPEQLQAEWNYIYAERLGILCGDGKITLSADYMAREEADEAVAKLRELNENKTNYAPPLENGTN